MTASRTPGEARAPTSLVLPAAAPFAWRHTLLALHDWGAAPDRGHATPDGAGWVLAVGGAAGGDALGAVELRAAPGGVAALVWAQDAQAAARELTWRLALDLDTGPLQARAANDPAFEPVAAALRGFHPPLFSSAFQAACWTLIRQRTPPAFARASMERLVELLGERVPDPRGGADLLLFPTPAALDDSARPALLAATNNLRKVERLRGVADAFLGVDEAWLRSATYEEAFRWLAALPGLGPWSAEQVMWRGLGRYERVPWRDTGASSAIGAVYLGGLTPARGTARELAEPYGWLQGLWLRYLKAYPRVRDLEARDHAVRDHAVRDHQVRD